MSGLLAMRKPIMRMPKVARTRLVYHRCLF